MSDESKLFIKINKDTDGPGLIIKPDQLESCLASIDYYETDIEKYVVLVEL